MPRKVKNGRKYALGIIINFVWMFILYRVVLMFSERLGTIVPYALCASVYLIGATVLLGIYYFGSSGETDAAKREKYKPLLPWAFPMVIVLLLDVLEVVVLDGLLNMF